MSFSEKKCATCNKRNKSVFCSLPEDELSKIDLVKKHLLYEKGEIIFQESHYPKGIYCIQKGKAKLSQLGADGKEQILHLAMDGDVMGYRATLSGDMFSCSATAIEKSFICFIPKEAFLSLVEKNSKLALQIIHLFSGELKKIENNLTQLSLRPVKERVAQALLLLKNKYGFEEDKSTIDIVIKREEIANMAATTRETATRNLYTLQEEGIIELNGKKIKILDLKRLIDESNVLF